MGETCDVTFMLTNPASVGPSTSVDHMDARRLQSILGKASATDDLGRVVITLFPDDVSELLSSLNTVIGCCDCWVRFSNDVWSFDGMFDDMAADMRGRIGNAE